MRCIFCKEDSSTSRSVEHIVPESLGSPDHVLPVGAVCDSCNQYFSRKVERQVLESPMFRHIRAGMEVLSKRGRVPGWEPADGIGRPALRQMSRFLAKVGLEVLAHKTLNVPSWNEELVNCRGLDNLRRFARYNEGADWPFTTRTLYPINAVFRDGDQYFELLNEFDILYTRSSEAYLVIALFGVEFVLNLGGRENDGYRQWLEAHDWASPLYVGNNV